MKKTLETSVFLVTLIAPVLPASAQDYGAAISGGGAPGAAAFRIDNGTLSYQIFLDASPSAARVGGTDLNASFKDGFAAGTVPFTGDLDGASLTFTGANASGTLVKTAEGDGGSGGGGGGGGDGLIDTGDTSACAAGAEILCLNGGRFEVKITFATEQGDSGNGQAIPLTNDTGYFFFFTSDNVEMVIKVLDACGINNRYWVFAGGLTDQQVDITIRDSTNGLARTYSNPLKTPFLPIQDTTEAFETCP